MGEGVVNMKSALRFLASLLLLGQLSACSVAEKSQFTPPFFKIEKDGEHLGYILGTIHYGIDYSDLPKKITSLAQSANTIVLETDLARAQIKLINKFPMGKPQSLKKHLTDKEWEVFYESLKDKLPNPEYLDRLHPVFANNLYLLSVMTPTAQPIDMTLYAQATTKNKDLVFLDDVDLQIDILEKTLDIKELKKQLSVPKEQLTKEVIKIIRAYRLGNIDALGEMVNEELTEKDYKLVIQNRNEAWLKKFKELFLQPGSKFIAIGAGHLGGSEGVIPLLQEEGFSVSPVSL